MYDRQKADIILDVPNSAAALAVATQAKNKKKLYINIGAGTTALTGASCNKYTFHWAYNTAVLARGTAGTITQEGGKKWNIVYPDYAFGQDMNKSFTAEVEKAGGTVGQSIASPFPSDNFATFITKAGEGDPDVVGSMHAGGDLINFVKQFNQSPLKGQVAARRRPDVHHRHPLAGCRPVRRHAVHRRLVLELRRRRTRSGPTGSRRRPTPARPSPTPATTRPR